VLLLVGRGCFSSNEEFIAAMAQIPNVTIAGDTTGGGSGNPATFDLGGGWQYSVPRWIEYTASLQVIEWKGIAPNVVVPAFATDFDGGVDPVLDYAARWATTIQEQSVALSLSSVVRGRMSRTHDLPRVRPEHAFERL
jgi:C-terminal processing protease CtpA/Prc